MFSFSVPAQSGQKAFQIEPGTSLYFVGANGGGKTRLAVKIEEELQEKAHRISAHRALSLNPEVAKISEKAALSGLRFGYAADAAGLGHRMDSRWGREPATRLLNDYDFLVQALFAEQSNVSLETHKNTRAGTGVGASATKFEKLTEIWDRVLPHRELHISGDNIQVSASGSTAKYAAPQMSDGERAVFYLLGQTLVAPYGSLIIFDEPELHIHRAIVARLWDELEAARPDCGMVIISHDLEFVASRRGQKFVLRDYSPSAGWTIEEVPEETGFDESLTTLILGSRKAVLFVEGKGSSLDQAIYRACYPNWTIVPRSSCTEVIHAVTTMRANAVFTRINCAGIVDADDYDTSELSLLRSKGIETLPVSEIENLLLLPNVIDAILTAEGHTGAALIAKRDLLMDELFTVAGESSSQRECVMRYCRRRIDRTLKKLDLSTSADVEALKADYKEKTEALDITALADAVSGAIQAAISSKDAAALLKWYDNKRLLSIASKAKGVHKVQFEQWVVRAMRNGTAVGVAEAIRGHLPKVQAC